MPDDRAPSLDALDPLERELRALGEHIVHPDPPDLAPTVLARLADPSARMPRMPRMPWWRRRPRIAVAVAIVVVIVIATLALPAPREAVADWFGIGAVRIVHTDEPAPPAGSQPAGSTVALGRPVSLDEARRIAGGTIEAPAALGSPSTAYAGVPSASSVTLVWAPRGDLPEVRTTGVGLLLTRIPGSLDRDLIVKMIHSGTRFESATVGTAPAYWIAGGHELYYIDPNGEPRLDSIHLAANTLLWTVGTVTYRLESNLDRATAVALASQMVPLR